MTAKKAILLILSIFFFSLSYTAYRSFPEILALAALGFGGSYFGYILSYLYLLFYSFGLAFLALVPFQRETDNTFHLKEPINIFSIITFFIAIVYFFILVSNIGSTLN